MGCNRSQPALGTTKKQKLPVPFPDYPQSQCLHTPHYLISISKAKEVIFFHFWMLRMWAIFCPRSAERRQNWVSTSLSLVSCDEVSSVRNTGRNWSKSTLLSTLTQQCALAPDAIFPGAAHPGWAIHGPRQVPALEESINSE